MMLLPWVLCTALAVTVAALCIKLRLMQKSLDELCVGLEEHLSSDTNTLLSISGRDRHVRRFAAAINRQLRLLRKQRHRFLAGDTELKNAVTGISHDLRTPLTAICGYLELLEQEKMSDDVRRYLEAISGRAEALKALTEELFRYSVILAADTPLQMERISLTAVLEEALAGMYAAFGQHGIVPDITLPEEAVYCHANRDALGRVLNNILSNALKYSDGDLHVCLTEDGCVTFANTARELSKVDIGRLFDRFYTVEAARNASGLGLSIAKHLMEQMEGEIRAAYRNEILSICITLKAI